MMLQTSITALALLLLPAANASFDLGFLRGGSTNSLDQFTCTLSGGTDQDTCDATTSEDGTKCVWCSIASFGVCVSEDIAEKIKGQIPGLECDDDNNTDDDSTATDDMAPATDDTAPNDDTVPDDYWNCLKKYADSTNCTSHGCAWCDTNGGFGICMNKDAAATASTSDWFDCKMPTLMLDQVQQIADPYDPSCIAVTLQGDESTCKATVDTDGNACEWCSIGTTELCLNEEQAALAEQVGASCNAQEINNHNFMDPYDPSCVAVTLQGDESTCKGTVDADGNSCEWCTVGSTQLCLNDEQATIAEQIGGSCDSTEKSGGILSLFF
ncbi:hypothetical protein IV203_030142 [Nitzschia inconspicua]|uniref:Uncharacterized protein n=1 Tax=Nitzschia inconspicua TaxID=303405 RepID=A0A9K3LVJ4_9STRA|nr:hypothetical protein IV203_004904 [Nitzschia inconspicua]KAG7367471.1 hypothetical protein IV203_030142 [Nitzschia inconspicua]